MRIKHTALTLLLLLVILVFGVSFAQATPISGAFSLGSGVSQGVVPVDGVTGAVRTLGTATALDFTTNIVSGLPVPTPGVDGAFTIYNATDSFLSLVGSIGTIKDFTFNGPGSANYPVVPVAAFETGDGGLIVDLKTIGVDFQNAHVLVLSGSAIFRLTGFDPTSGSFTFTANGAGRTFSFSASEAVPEPGSLFLLGAGIVAVESIRRRLIKR